SSSLVDLQLLLDLRLAVRQRGEHRDGVAACPERAVRADDQRGAARHAVGTRLLAELARADRGEGLGLAPAVALAVRIERAGRDAEALEGFGLVVARALARPANPPLAEHDRAGRHADEHDAALCRAVQIAYEIRAMKRVDAGLDVAAADEHEMRFVECGP